MLEKWDIITAPLITNEWALHRTNLPECWPSLHSTLYTVWQSPHPDGPLWWTSHCWPLPFQLSPLSCSVDESQDESNTFCSDNCYTTCCRLPSVQLTCVIQKTEHNKVCWLSWVNQVMISGKRRCCWVSEMYFFSTTSCMPSSSIIIQRSLMFLWQISPEHGNLQQNNLEGLIALTGKAYVNLR